MPPRASPFAAHVAKWSTCELCPLHHTRTKVVIARGSVPCDVLFVGEAPGVSENVLGRPFVGPAGRLLDEMIASASPQSLKLAFTNLVGCIPLDDKKTSEPSKESIKACAPRLLELTRMAKPKLIVLVGKLSVKYVSVPKGCHKVEIIHPAAILRADISQQGLAIQRCVVALADAFTSISEPE